MARTQAFRDTPSRRRLATRLCGLVAAGLVVGCGHAAPPAEPVAANVREVEIAGYPGIAMEPFVSRDGRFLLFNNSNDPKTNTDLFHARRGADALHWVFAGPVVGANSSALDATPTMDRAGRLYFVSTRSYAQAACTIHSARFDAGTASDVQLVDSICRHEPGIVNFDVDIDASGMLMTFVDSHFGRNGQPQDAILVMAHRDGARFVRDPDSARMLASVNGPGLQYAPCLSADHLTLWFTRVESVTGGHSPQIWRARRAVASAPFDPPVRVAGLGDFVEAPTLGPGEELLYFHRRVGSGFRIFAVPID